MVAAPLSFSFLSFSTSETTFCISCVKFFVNGSMMFSWKTKTKPNSIDLEFWLSTIRNISGRTNDKSEFQRKSMFHREISDRHCEPRPRWKTLLMFSKCLVKEKSEEGISIRFLCSLNQFITCSASLSSSRVNDGSSLFSDTCVTIFVFKNHVRLFATTAHTSWANEISIQRAEQSDRSSFFRALLD